MQIKSIDSLGTITGLNFILKVENDDLSTKLIEKREKALDFMPALEVKVPKHPASKLKYANSNHDHRGVWLEYLLNQLLNKQRYPFIG